MWLTSHLIDSSTEFTCLANYVHTPTHASLQHPPHACACTSQLCATCALCTHYMCTPYHMCLYPWCIRMYNMCVPHYMCELHHTVCYLHHVDKHIHTSGGAGVTGGFLGSLAWGCDTEQGQSSQLHNTIYNSVSTYSWWSFRSWTGSSILGHPVKKSTFSSPIHSSTMSINE